MADKRKKNPSELQSRAWTFVLYPDSESYDYQDTVDLIKSFTTTQYAFITHDKDVVGDDDVLENPELKKGELKKAHTHFCLKFESPKKIHQVRNILCLGENFYIKPCSKWNNSLDYLLHNTEDSSSKHHYDVSEVTTNIPDFASRVDKRNEVEALQDILDLRDEMAQKTNFVQCGALAIEVLKKADSTMWSALRRNYSIIKDMNEWLNAGFQQRIDQACEDFCNKQLEAYKKELEAQFSSYSLQLLQSYCTANGLNNKE